MDNMLIIISNKLDNYFAMGIFAYIILLTIVLFNILKTNKG